MGTLRRTYTTAPRRGPLPKLLWADLLLLPYYVWCDVQPVSAGGSNAGRRTVRVLQSLLDHYAVMPLPVDSSAMLGDTVSSQRTPIRFAPLLTVFR